MPTNAIWGKEASKGEGHQEKNEEIHRGDQGPRNPAYDEAKHSSDLENNKASH